MTDKQAREAFDKRHFGYEFPSKAAKDGAYNEFTAGWQAASQQNSGWLPIESAPKDGNVIIYSSRTKEILVRCWGDFCEYNTPKFTHWMPLPVLPPQPNFNKEILDYAKKINWDTPPKENDA